MSDERPVRRHREPAGETPGDGARAPFEGLADPRDLDVWDTLARWRGEGRRFALVSVVETDGFTPRKSGTHMLLDERGTTAGSIGGGAIEKEALDLAAARLAGREAGTILRRHLTRELGMCCGGEMTLAVEVIDARPRLLVCGAGYVARAVAALADGCGFDVTVVDARPEWLTRERFPRARLELRDPEDHARAWESGPRDFVVIATHDHALDQRIVQQLLARPLAFLGMIGSIPKQRKFALRLAAKGFTTDQIARLRTPLGLPLGGRSPEEIAVSVVAELIAVRHGATPERGWTPRTSASDVAADASAAVEDAATRGASS